MLAAPDLLARAIPGDLAAATALRREWPASLVAAATAQVELRRRAAAKFDRAQAMLFTRDGLEQASGGDIAAARAGRLAAAGVSEALDLCCGIGGDSVAMAVAGLAVTAVDRDPVHVRMTRHNATAYDVAVAGVVADVTTLRLRATAVVHIDPARRDARGRGGYLPGFDWCTALPVERTVVKAAPGLDKSLIPMGWEAEWVSSGRAVKACVLWSQALGSRPDARRATVVEAGSTLTRVADPDLPAPPVAAPGGWIVDPNPVVTLAGAVADLAAELDGWLIDPRIGFVCTDRQVTTRWGRLLRVEASLPWSEAAVAAELRRLGAGDLQIRRRGLAGDVESLRRRLLRGATGDRRVTLLLTRHLDRPWAIVTTDPVTGATAGGGTRVTNG